MTSRFEAEDDGADRSWVGFGVDIMGAALLSADIEGMMKIIKCGK